MSFSQYILKGWYSARAIWWLVPFSVLFGLIAALRKPWLRYVRQVKFAVPVVVVGNLTAGGAGKTPVVIWLCQQLTAQGYQVAVVSRGYGANVQEPIAVQRTASATTVGDEPLLIAQKTTAAVWVGPNRVAVVQALLAELQPDIIITDDGLQHYKLARDYEIAVIDGQRQLGNGWLIPAGPLRELTGRLASVDHVIMNGGQDASTLLGHLKPDSLSTMTLNNSHAINLLTGEQRPLTAFTAQPCLAIAGIANPQRFFNALTALGVQVQEHPLPDHYKFSATDSFLHTAQPILMTEKDAVKIQAFASENCWAVPAMTAIKGPLLTSLLKSLLT